jgi:hypothetical protein
MANCRQERSPFACSRRREKMRLLNRIIGLPLIFLFHYIKKDTHLATKFKKFYEQSNKKFADVKLYPVVCFGKRKNKIYNK